MRPPLPLLAAALAVTAVVSIPAQTAEGGDVYYRSNEIGMEFEEIPQAAAAEHRFVLVHRGAVQYGEAAGEERLLLDGGRQIRRWVTLRDAGGTLIAESDYADGKLVAERSFDDTGKLTEVSVYDGGVLASRTAYAYEPRMVQVVVTGSDGAVLQTATYELAATGQLRDFARVEPGADRLGVRFVFAGGTLVEEAVTSGATRLVSRYLAGERYEVEEWRGDVLHAVRELERSPDGFLVGETRIEPALDRRTASRFDAAGRVLEAVTTEGGRQVELVRHYRDAAGRIVTTRRETDAGEERWEYEYLTGPLAASASEDAPDDTLDDRLRTVRFEQNDEIVSVTTYEWPPDDDEPGDDGQPTRQADYYRDGAPYLRVHFRGDTRVREQVLKDGQVVRERVFDDGAGRQR